ncbi:lytic transglycosylase domain-containing protein [Streptomyces sp. GS7]|uniref:lytic transglycosylase domain-containing protein n=1 Tax=Streptomyces sp. GS7 TaxID=2692234 RepID=UPI001F3C0CD0|nr:lytic murein transglycosylase [Streptomyces sp. GS7]
MPPALSSALSVLLARRVRQGLCVCALAAGLTAASAISPLPVAGPPSADASGAAPDADGPQAQPRGVPDLDLPELPGGGRDGTTGEAAGGPRPEERTGIPASALDAYKKAERTLSSGQPSCHLPWQLVAGIGRVESVHASGYGLRPDGSTAKPIRGPRLDGKQFALIRDTDGGRWDGDTEFDRAVGPMQFIPSTWATWGADGNGDGANDPNNIYDAALGTAHYLCAGGRDLNRPADLDKAILSYNNSREYVNAVTDWMRTYSGGKVTATPDGAPAIPHRPDPADRRSPATKTLPRPLRVEPRPGSDAEQDRVQGSRVTHLHSKPVTPTRPAAKPIAPPEPPEKPGPAPDHRTVARLERVGGENLGDRKAGEEFARRPQVRATDAHGHPVARAEVTYHLVGTAAAHFPGHGTTATATTDHRGVATAPTVLAGDRPGRVTITATTPGKHSQATTTFTATVRRVPVRTPDLLQLLNQQPLQAGINSQFADPLRIRATEHHKPAPGVCLTATLLDGTEEPREATFGPYFKDDHGHPVRTLALPATDSDGRITLPQLFTDQHPGTYTLRLTTPHGATLDIPLTVGEPAPGQTISFA